MTETIWIVGAGSEGHVIASWLDDPKDGKIYEFHFIDPIGDLEVDWPGIEYMADVFKEGDSFILAIGDNRMRKSLLTGLENYMGDKLISLYSIPSEDVNSKAHIGPFCIFHPGSVVGPHSRVGYSTIANNNSVISHDCKICSFSQLGPGAVVCGNVTIGNGTFVGANATVTQGTEVPPWRFIKAGSVVHPGNVDELPELE